MDSNKALEDLDKTLKFFVSEDGKTSFSSSFMSQYVISEDGNTLKEDLDDLNYNLMFNFSRLHILNSDQKIRLETIINEKVKDFS